MRLWAVIILPSLEIDSLCFDALTIEGRRNVGACYVIYLDQSFPFTVQCYAFSRGALAVLISNANFQLLISRNREQSVLCCCASVQYRGEEQSHSKKSDEFCMVTYGYLSKINKHEFHPTSGTLYYEAN